MLNTGNCFQSVAFVIIEEGTFKHHKGSGCTIINWRGGGATSLCIVCIILRSNDVIIEYVQYNDVIM